MGKLKTVEVTFELNRTFIYNGKRAQLRRISNYTYRCEFINVDTDELLTSYKIMPIEIDGSRYTFITFIYGKIHNIHKNMQYEDSMNESTSNICSIFAQT